MVPVECMTAPPEDWMCREVDDSHVDELYQSMKLNPGVSSLSEPNGLVIIDPKLADLALNNKITFDELVDYMKANPAYTYHGEHRRRAYIISVVPQVQAIDDYLLAMGLGINNLGDIRKKIT